MHFVVLYINAFCIYKLKKRSLFFCYDHFFLLFKGSDAAGGCQFTKLGSNRKLLLFVVVVFLNDCKCVSTIFGVAETMCCPFQYFNKFRLCKAEVTSDSRNIVFMDKSRIVSPFILLCPLMASRMCLDQYDR